MKFLIAGAGAIGAYIGARMAQAGFDVALFARGPLREGGPQENLLELVANAHALVPDRELAGDEIGTRDRVAQRPPELVLQRAHGEVAD